MKKDITYLIYKINSYFRLTTTNTSKTDNSKLYTNNKGEHFRFIPVYSAPAPPEEEEDLFSPYGSGGALTVLAKAKQLLLQEKKVKV